MNELKHLAIIMDGNGRWAKRRGFLRTRGHETGANVVEAMCEFCIQNGIGILSLYAFSTENWKRPKAEVDFLMNLLQKFMLSKREKFVANGIKFNTIGELGAFSEGLQNEIKTLKSLTENGDKLRLNLAINYGAKDEILRAFGRLKERNLEPSEANLNACMDESEPIDLLVRTGGEQRISNFMLWQAAYAELTFTPTLWPDFTADELAKIVREFRGKERRFGGI